jgi:hypothetical protein
MDMTPPNLGQWLLDRAHEHGLTSEQTADILGMPVDQLRRLTPADLTELPVAKVADLATRLGLDWPTWLTLPPAPHETTGPATPPPEAARDANRLNALLTLAIGARLHTDQIARILGWPIARVHAATARLIPRLRGRHGLRLLADADVLQLTVSPGLINQQERRRLADLLQAGHGHTSASALVVYRAIYLDPKQLSDLFAQLPDILDHAVQAGLITYELSEDHHPANIKITPEVAFSLGKTNDLRTSPTE